MRQLLKENNERSWYLIAEWVTKVGLKARVHQCVWNERLTKVASSLHPFYTGYVEVPPDAKIDEEKLEVHGGVTFSRGKLAEVAEGEWIGFDMAHFGDENIQSEEYAIEQCEKLAEQILV